MHVETFTFNAKQGWSISGFPQLDSPQTLVVTFGAPELGGEGEPLGKALGELRAAYPQAQHFGCSTSGEIHGTTISDHSLSVAVARFDHATLASASAPVRDTADSFAAGAKVAEALRGPTLLRHAGRHGHPGGAGAHAVRGQSSGAVLLLRDVGERKQLEVTLRHAQKLESVGRMAAGVAHEINTPVQFIGDNVHFLDDAFGELLALVARAGCVDGNPDLASLRQDIPRAIASAMDGLDRVAKIVKAMKIFSRQDQTEEQSWTDLRTAIESTITVARNETRFVADVVTEIGDVPPIMAHPNDLNQVFLNLLVNAAHAVGDVVLGTDRRGRITVRTWRDGADVVIAVQDTGAGIPESIRDRVFDPFFTTKEVGKGTGQGLALARSVVVDKHGGSIGFESTVGKGTTFSIRLPIEGRRPSSLAPCSGRQRSPASAA